jgi:hypothetical protein
MPAAPMPHSQIPTALDKVLSEGGNFNNDEGDRNDAIGIARIMQTGWFKEVHVKDIDSHSVRALLRAGRC